MWRGKAYKANLLSIRWNWYFFSAFTDGWKLAKRLGDKRHRFPIFLKSRGANFACCWIGPVFITWRMPWIESVARIQHPEWFKEAAR